MFYASDGEDEPGQVSASDPALPSELSFLTKACFCKYRECFRQFRGQASELKKKRDEFQTLEPHEKET